eukprot:365926-Chlamydomonas_euryale.AAC.9
MIAALRQRVTVVLWQPGHTNPGRGACKRVRPVRRVRVFARAQATGTVGKPKASRPAPVPGGQQSSKHRPTTQPTEHTQSQRGSAGAAPTNQTSTKPKQTWPPIKKRKPGHRLRHNANSRANPSRHNHRPCQEATDCVATTARVLTVPSADRRLVRVVVQPGVVAAVGHVMRIKALHEPKRPIVERQLCAVKGGGGEREEIGHMHGGRNDTLTSMAHGHATAQRA